MIYRFLFCSLVLLTCASTPAEKAEKPSDYSSQDFNSYWYSGKAEISSYALKQARYGQIHEGTSVLIFVTEPFNKEKLVKSDYGSDNDVSVLKLNSTKKFNTGIYPYSMMTSTFLPVENPEHSLKISSSSQEWCGHTFTTLENKTTFEIDIESYFEGESAEISMPKTLLEDDMWSKIRLQPEELPQGKLSVIPSFFFLRLKHKETKGYSCVATLEKNNRISTYTMSYEGLKRSISINFESEFPHKITSWKETYPDGWSADAPVLTTEAELIKSIQSDYWNKNSNSDTKLRTELGLP
ncbi:MAG: septum formation inhibitor Maf [Flavobacteriales bacterium]